AGRNACSALHALPTRRSSDLALNGAGLTSAPSTFTVTPDGQAPTTTISCDGGSCAGWHTSTPVSVSLNADDGAGSGVTQIRYTKIGRATSELHSPCNLVCRLP